MLSEREADEIIDASPADKPLYPRGWMPTRREIRGHARVRRNLTMPGDKGSDARVNFAQGRSLLIFITEKQRAPTGRPRDWSLTKFVKGFLEYLRY